MLRSVVGEDFYQIHLQQPGVAEADLARNVRGTIRDILFGASGDNPTVPDMMVKPGLGLLGQVAMPESLPDWLTEADSDVYTREFERTGFAGGLKWYRNIDRNWELTAPWSGAVVTPPALYVVSDRDVVYHFPGGGRQMLDNLSRAVPNLKQAVLLEGCGRWTQQERPDEVNRLLIDFLRSLQA